MKFFFPDAHDLVDPTFDFNSEIRTFAGSRQQSQLYAHEYLEEPPYDGMLLSKAMVDSNTASKGIRYSFAQVQRFVNSYALIILNLKSVSIRLVIVVHFHMSMKVNPLSALIQ